MAGERTLAGGAGMVTDWDEASDGWKDPMDLNLIIVNYGLASALVVQSRLTALPEGTVPDAVVYIATTGEATGIDEHDLAIRDEDAWIIRQPQIGLHAYVIDEAAWYVFDGTLWVPTGFDGSKPVTVAGTSFAPTAVNMGTYNRLMNAGSCEVTLPDDMPAGKEIHFEAAGGGSYTFIGASTGTTILFPASRLAQLGEQHSVLTAKSLGSDTWILIGALAEAST